MLEDVAVRKRQRARRRVSYAVSRKRRVCGERGSLMAWPDIIIAGILVIGAVKGWKRGFVSEIGGAIAIAVALWAAFHYTGSFDAPVERVVHLSPGSNHMLALILYAIFAYLTMLGISFVLDRFASLPLINIANAAGGALVGAIKGAVFVWAVLYVALLFPLSGDVRSDLRHSQLVHVETQPNQQIDDVVASVMPWFMRPFVAPLMKGHRV